MKIQVLDVNDNRPELVFPNASQGLTRGRYFAAIPRAAQFASTVVQVTVHDKDNGKYGKLEYRILDGRGSGYFSIDSSTGIIRTAATFDRADAAELPFKFNVRVRDNPNSTDNYNTIVAPVIVNLIGEENLMILVVRDAAPDALQKDAGKIAGIIEAKSGLLIGIDRVAVRKTLTKNGTVEMFPRDSDVWFYAVDPDTEAILDRNSTKVQRYASWIILNPECCCNRVDNLNYSDYYPTVVYCGSLLTLTLLLAPSFQAHNINVHPY